MKLLIAVTANTSWYIYNFRKNLIAALLSKSYRILVIAPYDSYTEKLIDLGCEYEDIRIDRSGKNPFRDIASFIRFHKVFTKHKPGVVLNFTPKNNIYGTLAAVGRKIKVVNNIAGLGAGFVGSGFTEKISLLLYRASQRRADMVFFQNEEDRSFFLKLSIVKEDRTYCLPGSGVDLARFYPSQRQPDGSVKFLMISRILYNKGVSEYVEAAKAIRARYSNVEFRLLGFIDENSSSAVPFSVVQDWDKEGHISFLGASDKVEDEIKLVDCVVLPSFYREGVPRSLLEAAAMGKPLITTDNVGCREVVVNQYNGFICAPQSSSSLILAIEKFLHLEYSERVEMGRNSRELVESRFNESIVIERYCKAIKS